MPDEQKEGRRWTIPVCSRCDEECPPTTRLERDLTTTHARGILDSEECGGKVERIEVMPVSEAQERIEAAEKRAEGYREALEMIIAQENSPSTLYDSDIVILDRARKMEAIARAALSQPQEQDTTITPPEQLAQSEPQEQEGKRD